MLVGERAVIPNRRLEAVPTFGLGITVQLIPSKCSMRVSVGAFASGVEAPTAQTLFDASASALFNWLLPLPTLAVAAVLQF
jgi:hypothetical protein